MPSAQPSQAISLYDKIGGAPAVAALVEQFYALVAADPALAPYFRNVAMDKLRRMQSEFFSAALGGPMRYTGRSLIHAHQGKGITLDHFQKFVGHLFTTLAQYRLSDQERYDVISRLNVYTNEVVSAGTGIVG